MTDRNPKIAFGLLATTCALKAKTARLKRSDKQHLLDRVCDWHADVPGAGEAVVDFLDAVDTYPLFASDRLQDFVRDLVPAGNRVGDLATVLNAAQAHAEQSGWAARRDCGHD